MIENKFSVVSLAKIGKGKFNKKRWSKLCEIVEKHDIVVTHHCTIALHAYYCLLTYKYKNKKFVSTIHSCYEKKYNLNYNSLLKNFLAYNFIKLMLKRSDKIVFVSEAGYRSYKENFIFDNQKSIVIYNGVEELETRHNEINKGDCIRITYIGRLEKIKGIDLLIEAVKQLIENKYNVKVWLIGDGTYRLELENMVIKYQLDDYISFLGTQRNIGHYMERTDIFVYPSICEEVFGISIVEAMAYGVPCVSNRVGGIPEIIKNGYNGYLSCENKAESLYSAICKLIELPDIEVEKIKNNCLDTAEKFSIQNTVRNLEKLFMRLYNNDKK